MSAQPVHDQECDQVRERWCRDCGALTCSCGIGCTCWHGWIAAAVQMAGYDRVRAELETWLVPDEDDDQGAPAQTCGEFMTNSPKGHPAMHECVREVHNGEHVCACGERWA